ncbi:enamine deaminase RidA [Enterococcus silesiacus]|uniref:Enamine deaminase RidA n=1 Tax=Enterococcus silesiacus TaxID=332949 RepID=A0A0S3K870_9ENTE|nr:RidA family protein [Enterococcus silesiacus]ALS00476.1 enamine deaminase RidA [Enterococcus silesiacus]OJG91291.1 endoribonuclease L-PSP [Enterococcus silesiacus]
MKKSFEQINITPDPYAPFNLSQGISLEKLLFISGQTSINELGELLHPGDFTAQAEQTFINLRKVLNAGGSSLDNVLKVTIFLTDMSHFQTIVALREKYFSKPFPADTIVEINGLFHPDALIEIEAIAVKN